MKTGLTNKDENFLFVPYAFVHAYVRTFSFDAESYVSGMLVCMLMPFVPLVKTRLKSLFRGSKSKHVHPFGMRRNQNGEAQILRNRTRQNLFL